MTVASEMVLNYLKQNFGTSFTKQELAANLGISLPSVTGSINSLEKKGYVTHTTEVVEESPATETRKAKVKNVLHHTLTEAGLAYDPIAEAEEKAAKLAAERAAKAAAKAAAKVNA